MPGIDDLRALLNRDPGAAILRSEDHLSTPPVAVSTNAQSGERVLLVRLDGNYYIETVENAAIAAVADPDFVVAIPLSRLRALVGRSVN